MLRGIIYHLLRMFQKCGIFLFIFVSNLVVSEAMGNLSACGLGRAGRGGNLAVVCDNGRVVVKVLEGVFGKVG